MATAATALLCVLMVCVGRVESLDESQCKEDEKHVCVDIKCAWGSGYILRVDWLGLGDENKEHKGSHIKHDLHKEDFKNPYGYKQEYEVLRLPVGQGVENIRARKGFEFTFRSGYYNSVTLKADKSGKIKCDGFAWNPKCRYA